MVEYWATRSPRAGLAWGCPPPCVRTTARSISSCLQHKLPLQKPQTHTHTNIHTQSDCDSRNMGSTQMLHKASEADAEGSSTLPGCQQRKSTCSDVNSLELIWICLDHPGGPDDVYS